MEAIGGYRVIRKLGSGDRSEVFLGRAETAPGAQSHLAAIKVFRPGASEAGIDAEIDALSSLDSPHIVRLLDLASGPGNLPTLILQRLDSGGLVKLLAERTSLRAGEAVTILAPIAIAIDHLHSRGIVHGHLRPAAVHFDASGAPVIIGFGSAGRVVGGGDEPFSLPSPAEREADDGVRRDLTSLVGLVRTVLSRVAGAPVSLERFGTGVASPHGGPPSAPQLAEWLFSIAAPLPVSFDEVPGAVTPVPSRALAIRPGTENGGEMLGLAADRANQSVSEGSDAGGTLALAFRRVAAVRKLARQAVDRIHPLRVRLGAVSTRVRVFAGLGACAAVAAVLLAHAQTSAGPGVAGSVPAPGATVVAPEASVADPAIVGDDPVAAAGALIQLRRSCFEDRSIMCLDGVDQSGSAAWQSDVASIRDLQNGGELGSSGPGAVGELMERLGGSALISLAPPQAGTDATASVLIVKTEAGWRIRSMLPAR